MHNATDAAGASWRDHFRIEEVADAAPIAGDLFRRRFGHEIPNYPRHFVLIYSAPAVEGGKVADRLVAYGHQLPFKEVYLGGGICVDEGAYRSFPKWLFAEVRRAGGLATILTRGSMEFLGESPASFGHVGEPRARQADLRTGYVDTGRPPLMVYWRKDLPAQEKERLIEMVAAYGPF